MESLRALLLHFRVVQVTVPAVQGPVWCSSAAEAQPPRSVMLGERRRCSSYARTRCDYMPARRDSAVPHPRGACGAHARDGRYSVAVDMVAAGLTWFEELGSATLRPLIRGPAWYIPAAEGLAREVCEGVGTDDRAGRADAVAKGRGIRAIELLASHAYGSASCKRLSTEDGPPKMILLAKSEISSYRRSLPAQHPGLQTG